MKNLSTNTLVSVFNSPYPVDSYIIKGRLETEGIKCFVFDENVISVNPFNSVTIGGVKLKVRDDQLEMAESILQKIENHRLFDENGEYELYEIFENEIRRQECILRLRKSIHENPKILGNQFEISTILEPEWFSDTETQEIIHRETGFYNESNTKFKFSWKKFLLAFLDYERGNEKFRPGRPNEFYLEKDILNNFEKAGEEADPGRGYKCPNCNSSNVRFGLAMNYRYDILYLVLSLLILAPLPPFRKNYHCFDCGHSFRAYVAKTKVS